jgi:acyl carrier protein
MMQQQHLREWVRTHLVESFLDGPAASLADDDDLLTVLNSLEVLRMVLDLEGQFSIQIDNSELTAENLGTVRRIAAFVAEKLRAARGSQHS